MVQSRGSHRTVRKSPRNEFRVDYRPVTSCEKLMELSQAAEDVWSKALANLTHAHADDDDDNHHHSGHEADDVALQQLETTLWKRRRVTSDGIVTYSRTMFEGLETDEGYGRTAYKIEGFFHLDREPFFDVVMNIYLVERVPEWNRCVDCIQVLQEVDPDTHLLYQRMTRLGPAGILAPRDFVMIRRVRKVLLPLGMKGVGSESGDAEDQLDGVKSASESENFQYLSCFASIELPDLPPVPGVVRGRFYPCAVLIAPAPHPTRTNDTGVRFVTVTDFDLKLPKIPQFIYDHVFCYFAYEAAKDLRARCKQVKKNKRKSVDAGPDGGGAQQTDGGLLAVGEDESCCIVD